MKKPIAVFGLILILALVAVPLIIVLSPKVDGPDQNRGKVIEETQFLMGTAVNVRLYGGPTSIFDPLFKEAARLEGLLSLNMPKSDLNRINSQAGRAPVKVQPETLEVVDRGLYYSRLSGGAFDITIGPLVELWHIGYDDARVPSPAEIRQTLPLVDWEKVEVNREESTVFLREPGMVLDLGGIAKGYIADKMADFLKARGYTQALFNLGGNILVMGEKSDGTGFGIGIQDPKDLRGSMIGVISIRDRSVVTTGTYERYLQVDDRIYHHVLDPFTGYPVDNPLLQVTIVSRKSLDGDGLSTSLFALGLREGMALAESLPDVEAVFVDRDNRIYLSSGLRDHFGLTNEAYRLAPPVDN